MNSKCDRCGIHVPLSDDYINIVPNRERLRILPRPTVTVKQSEEVISLCMSCGKVFTTKVIRKMIQSVD